ncbi:hypothetical protein ABZW32_07620 [Streptomyces sp. NPDC004667]|uniref:hypothetical protein n=1 Tax=Streptomyces sp. NPDC004667 TaxID=3154285 RepID=UPI0033ADF57F
MSHLVQGLAANPALPPPFVARLVAHAVGKDAEEGYWVASVLIDRTDLSREQALTLVAHEEVRAVGPVRRGLLRADDIDPRARPDAALALLDEGLGLPHWPGLLVTDPDPGRRDKLASCPGLPPEVAARLAADHQLDVVTSLAAYGTPDPATAALLAAHPHAEVRLFTAFNEAVPPAVLSALLTGEGLPPAAECTVCEKDPELRWYAPYVRGGADCDGSHRSTVRATRRAALENPSTPAGDVARFAGDPSMLLREPVAARAGLPDAVYAGLARDPVPGVLWALAGNPGTGEAVIRELAAGRDPEVLARLIRHPRLPLDVLAGLAARARAGRETLPRIAAATAAEVDELAASPEAGVRALVARRRDLPPAVRDALAADPDAKVVKAVASHPGLGEHRLRAMAARHGVHVLAQVAANPDAPGALLEELVRHDPPVLGVLRAVARHPNATGPALLGCLADVRSRRHVAAHPALPAGELARLLDDPDGQVVEAAAAHPALPLAVMRESMP